jgi:hypothetical protein
MLQGRKAGSSLSVYHTAAKVIRISPSEETGEFRIAVRFQKAQAKTYHLEVQSRLEPHKTLPAILLEAERDGRTPKARSLSDTNLSLISIRLTNE